MFPKETRILIVDDEPMERTFLEDELVALGYTVLAHAQHGKEALELLDKGWGSGKPFGLIVSDWKMPQMDGLELLKHIRSKSQWANLPVVFLTALSNLNEITTALYFGVNGYIVKPVQREMLRKQLSNVHSKLMRVTQP